MKHLSVILAGLMFAWSAIAFGQRGPIECTVEVTVVNSKNQPVQGAKVVAGFSPGGEMGGAKRPQEGMTNAEGKASLTDQSIFPISIYVTKDGYYRSHTELPIYQERKPGVYDPVNNPQATVLLREVMNPTSMYAKRVSSKIPVMGETIGYDFETGDWVSPHGAGKTTMVKFRMTRNVISQDEYIQTLEMSFPNNGDGISSLEENEKWFQSAFEWPYQVPELSFEPHEEFIRSRGPEKGMTSKAGKSRYLLRVNTQLDNGKVKTCNYVRLENDLSLFGVLSNEPGLKFTYYFNPKSNDRNLEFDPTRNLFEELHRDELVVDP